MSPSTDTSESRAFASELKFLISPDRAAAIRDWARGRLNPDPNGSGQSADTYLTSSICFDTPAFDVYARNGSFKRGKYRIRRYCDGPVLFLERKLKIRDLVSKRRSTIDLNHLRRIAGPDPDKGWPGYWFHRRLLARSLDPVCQISYERTARVAMTGAGAIRLTLDRDIRAVPLDMIEFRPFTTAVTVTDSCVLEIKYRHAMPALFKQLLVEFSLTPRPLSKYRLAVETLQIVAPRERVGVYA